MPVPSRPALDALLDGLAALVELGIAPSAREPVLDNLEILLGHAEQLLSFPLTAADEQSGHFEP